MNEQERETIIKKLTELAQGDNVMRKCVIEKCKKVLAENPNDFEIQALYNEVLQKLSSNDKQNSNSLQFSKFPWRIIIEALVVGFIVSFFLWKLVSSKVVLLANYNEFFADSGVQRSLVKLVVGLVGAVIILIYFSFVEKLKR